MTTRESLVDFAKAVRERCASAPPAMRFGRYKVFIAELDLGRTGVELLLEAHRSGLLRLSRADLVPAMDSALVAKSEVSYLNACFHFVDLENM